MIGVIVVDDQQVVRAGLRMLAEHDGDIEVVAEADSGTSGVRAVRRHRPDVVLMDIRMPGMDGLTATREIVADPALRAVRVAILTTFDEDENVLTAIRYGAAGYLLKDIGPIELRSAIRVLAAGDALLSPAVTTTVMRTVAASAVDLRPELLTGLTDREREVLARVALGDANQEIGRSLHISPATARTYVSRLMQKLQARDRAQLVVIGYESGLVTPGSAPRDSMAARRRREWP